MIHIKDDYYIDADKYCFQLKKKIGVDKHGEDKYSTLCYTRTVAECLQKLVSVEQQEVVETKDGSLVEFIEIFKDINNEIKSILQTVKDTETLKEDNK